MFRMRMQSRAGFALVDLVVLLILMITVVVGLGLPLMLKIRHVQALQATKDNMRKCGEGVHRAHDAHKSFPPYFGVYGGSAVPLTFHAQLLPFVGMKDVYKQDPINGQAIIPPYLSGLDPTQTNSGAGAANFAVNLRLFYTLGGTGVLATESTNLIYLKMSKIQDGTSNTLLFATRYQNCGAGGGSMWFDPGNNGPASPTAATFGASTDLWQKAPTQAACNPTAGTAVSFMPDEIQVSMCDASVRSVSAGIAPEEWRFSLFYASGRPMDVDGWPE